MYGCYLTPDDDKFLDVITDELDKYTSSTATSFILLFPSLSARHRLLLHRLREQSYSSLFSFSVGEQKQSRRTIICFKSQLMDETNTVSSSTDTCETSMSPKVTTVNSNDESSVKRRPTQALYKPPRRSKNVEVSTPISTPPPPPPPPSETTIEDVQQNNDTPKPTKSKTARPSAEPYVPPSRRSQLVNKEPLPSASSNNKNDPTEHQKEEEEEEQEEEEDWEKLLDGNENPLNTNLIDEIQTKFKDSMQIKQTTNDYSQWSVDDIQMKEADLAHVIEVSNFPSTFRTEDLSSAFKTLTRSNFDIKWVDETHALIIFPDAQMALDALQLEHPLYQVCSMSQASAASKKKAKNSIEFIQPYKTRPQTSSLTANRRICAALGLKNPMSSDKTKTERQKIESAKQEKIRNKEEQKTVWDGGVLPAT